MGKHSKNNNDRAFFSNAERKAAASGRQSGSFIGQNNWQEWGWGSESQRLDSASMKDIDVCSLSLQPCVQPVVTPSGILFDKETIIEYILSRKKEIERETKAWEAQNASDANDAAVEAAAAQESRISEFVAQQEGLSQADLRARNNAAAAASSSSSSSNTGGGSGGGFTTASTVGRTLVADTGVHAADTSFWVASQTPGVKRRVEKPDTTVRCPITNEPLRLKAMVPVIFTKADEGATAEELAAASARERYICPLTKKALTNVNPPTVLKPSGMAVSSACVKDFLKKEMVDPFTDPPVRLREKDFIALRVEGTGFAAKTDEKVLKAEKVVTGGGGGW